MVKKIISPIIYFFSFPLAVFISAIVYSMLNPVTTDGDFTYGMSLLPGMGSFYVIVLIMTVFFFFMSVLASIVESLKKPIIKDHFRQSLGIYILLPIISIALIILQFKLLVVFLAMCLWAIIINAIYLIIIRKYYLNNKLIINH